MSPLFWVLAAGMAAYTLTIGSRQLARRKLLTSLRVSWGQPIDRERDLSKIASYHFALAGKGADAPALDDRTWIDLNMDDVFGLIDRTQSSVGQQVLYHRLRASPTADHLDAFERLVAHMGEQTTTREAAQVALGKLSDKAGYDVWSLAQPGVLEHRRWFVMFPIIGGTMAALAILAFFWPPALLFLMLGVAVSIGTRMLVASYVPLVLGPFRQLGPLIAIADEFRALTIDGADPILGTLAKDVARLARLRRVAAWVSRDSATGPDLTAIFVEYVNLLLLFDANALYFGARELEARRAELLRVLASVGEVDAAISVASFRASTPGWTRPVFLEPGAQSTLTNVTHPLVMHAVPNSIVLGPPAGLIVTGSNMSGKSTFLRTVGVTTVMAQTIHTCLATAYQAPIFAVRSCIGRADDLVAGKSYYIVEVESVLALVRASQTPVAHLFLFDELFRGTNAVERIAAGEAVLAELVRPVGGRPSPHIVIAATHDRELVDFLAETYAAYHFTDTVGPDGLTFNFRLEPGPATTRNAIALLQLSGAPSELIERALRRAAALDDARVSR